MLEVLKRYDQQITTTNFKVGLMLSFLVTVIWGLTLHVKSVPTPVGVFTCKYIVIIGSVIITITLALSAILNLFRAVSPNTDNPNDLKSLIFFGDVSKYSKGNDYYEEITKANMESLTQDLAIQTHTLSVIVTEKFRLIRIATNLIKFGVIPLALCSLIFILTV